jgi:hypothetical protein
VPEATRRAVLDASFAHHHGTTYPGVTWEPKQGIPRRTDFFAGQQSTV